MDGAVIRASVLALSMVATVAWPAVAQEQSATPSLAEVARQAEAAKPAIKKAKKTYTNADLAQDPRGEPAPAAPLTEPSKSLDKPVTPKEAAARSDAKVDAGDAGAVAQESEEDWRTRADAVRREVVRMTARLTELTTSNASRAENAEVRARNASDISNTRTALELLRKQWGRIEAAARERKIPMSWIEPPPAFPPQ